MPAATKIDFRVNKKSRTLIKKAAAKAGLSLSDFAKGTVLTEARHVLKQQQTVLSDRDRDIFLAMLDADSKPNAALRSAVRDYAGSIGQVTVPLRHLVRADADSP